MADCLCRIGTNKTWLTRGCLQVSPVSAAHNAAGCTAGKAHGDVLRNQEPGLGHADAGV